MLHPQAEASYRVVALEEGKFAVEVRAPEAEPALVTTFGSSADAEAWITEQKARILAYKPGRRYSSGGFKQSAASPGVSSK